MVFEQLTVAENLDLRQLRRYRWCYPVGGAMRPGSAALETTGLAPLAEHPAACSHGQRQWLEIGMLIVQQSRLLLLDEPVAGMVVLA